MLGAVSLGPVGRICGLSRTWAAPGGTVVSISLCLEAFAVVIIRGVHEIHTWYLQEYSSPTQWQDDIEEVGDEKMKSWDQTCFEARTAALFSVAVREGANLVLEDNNE